MLCDVLLINVHVWFHVLHRIMFLSKGKTCLTKEIIVMGFAPRTQQRQSSSKIVLMGRSEEDCPFFNEISLSADFSSSSLSTSSTDAHVSSSLKGMKAKAKLLALWSAQEVRLYQLDFKTLPSLLMSFSFTKKILSVTINETCLFLCKLNETKIDAYRTLTSELGATEVTKLDDSVQFNAQEGCPILLDIQGNILAVITEKHFLALFSMENKNFLQRLGNSERLVFSEEEEVEHGDDVRTGKPVSMHMNTNATLISFILTESDQSSPDSLSSFPSRFCIYDVTRGAACPIPGLPSEALVIDHLWDTMEPNILVCVCKMKSNQPLRDVLSSCAGMNARKSCSLSGEEESLEEYATVVTLFVSPEDAQVICMDSFPLPAAAGDLLEVNAPYVYFSSSSIPSPPTPSTPPSSLIFAQIMPSFAGLSYENFSLHAKSCLKAFHFQLFSQDWHAAHQSLRIIFPQRQPDSKAGKKCQNEEPNDHNQQLRKEGNCKQQLLCIWRNMAHLSLRNRRVEVAEHCLSYMGHIRGVHAVREAVFSPSLYPSLPSLTSFTCSTDIPLAMVAIQLGLLQEAAALYIRTKRFDLLNRMYQAAGKWEKALQVAEKDDRLHLRTTHFQYARRLERLSEWDKAIFHYEKAGAQAREVPRMLHKAGKIEDLEKYLSRQKSTVADRESGDAKMLWRWWGRYCESKRDVKAAKEAYRKAADLVALVRLACVAQDVGAAEALLDDKDAGALHQGEISWRQASNHAMKAAASYHLARHYEGALYDVLPALTHYARAGCFKHCIRLAKAHELDNDVMQYALQSGQAELMQDSAQYFLKLDQSERAQELIGKARKMRES